MGNLFIDKLNGFAQLTTADEAALRAVTSDPNRYPAKHDLIREGDQPGPVFVVLEGWVSRYKILPSGSRQIVAFLMPGDCCDLHVGMLSEMDHSIQTITEAKVATIAQSDMQLLMSAGTLHSGGSSPPSLRRYIHTMACVKSEGFASVYFSRLGMPYPSSRTGAGWTISALCPSLFRALKSSTEILIADPWARIFGRFAWV